MPLERDDVGFGAVEVPAEGHGCPADYGLILFAARMLGAGEAAAFSQHVDSCHTCRSRVAAIQATPGIEEANALSPASLEPVATIGQRLGRFTLTRLLGRGGMGEVWAARDPELEREVAIKLLYVDFGGMDHDGQARLRREAQAMARVNHPNIVRIYELGADGDRLFCAMELVEGETLRRWLETPRPWRETLDVLLAAGRGVAAAHAAGLVHRDVKPDNVMIARDGRILVADFGLAKLAGMGAEPAPAAIGSVDLTRPNMSLTTTGSFLGTPMYMAPEVLEARDGDALSDQFSFCVMAYEALYRALPFRGTTLGELMDSVHEEPASPPPGRRGPPRGIWRCIRRGIAVAKEGRWPTMAPLLAGLERAAAAPRRRRLAIATAAVLALSASSVIVLASPEPDEEELVREVGATRMADVWSRSRRDDMRTAFDRAKEPAVAEQGVATIGALDRYRDAWLAMRLDVWRATNRRKEQSARLLELRMRCLDRLADEMNAFLEIAADADKPDELGRIGGGVSRLTPVATCADEGKMAAIFPATIDDDRPDLRKKFDIEEARMRAASAAMEPADAIKAIQARIVEADRARVPGLSSGFLFLLAVAQSEAGDIAGAEATLRKLIQEAARARRHFMVAAGWLRLIQSLSGKQLRMDEAIALEPTARAAVAQAGDEPRLRAELATTLGGIAWQKGDLAEARDRFLEARDVMVAAFGPKDEVAAGSEISLAMAQFELKELDEATRHAQHAYEVLHEKGIDSDRSAGKALMVLAWVARERKDWEAAARHSRESIATMARLHGTDNLELAFSRRELGHALSELERHDEAIEQMTMCVDVFRRVGPKHPDTLVAQLELGELYEKARRYADAEKIDRETVEHPARQWQAEPGPSRQRARRAGPHGRLPLTGRGDPDLRRGHAHHEQAARRHGERARRHAAGDVEGGAHGGPGEVDAHLVRPPAEGRRQAARAEAQAGQGGQVVSPPAPLATGHESSLPARGGAHGQKRRLYGQGTQVGRVQPGRDGWRICVRLGSGTLRPGIGRRGRCDDPGADRAVPAEHRGDPERGRKLAREDRQRDVHSGRPGGLCRDERGMDEVVLRGSAGPPGRQAPDPAQGDEGLDRGHRPGVTPRRPRQRASTSSSWHHFVAGAVMLFRSHVPGPPLAGQVNYLWSLSDAPPHGRERITPSGTLELVINLHEDEFRIYDPQQPERCRRFAGAMVSGAYAGYFVIDTREHASVLGVHFRPGGALPFLGVPAAELAGAHVGLDALWGARAAEVAERLRAAPTTGQRFALLERALTDRLARPVRRHPAVPVALDELERGTPVAELAARVHLSHRRLIEVFEREVGMAPKLFGRIRRFQRCLERIRREPTPDWARLAAACGYFDQSHMIRDVTGFSGFSPAELHRRGARRVKQHHVAADES